MEPNQFDRMTIAFSTRLSRRHALTAGTAGFGATILGRGSEAWAQEATPDAIDPADSSPGFLYIQLAERGTWTPKPGEDGLFELALYGTGEQTLFFATGSSRIVGTMPTVQILDEIGFTPEDPPNAAIEVWTANGERDVLVVQLIDPVYVQSIGDNSEEALIYDARVLSAYTGERLTEWLPDVDDDQLPLEFTNASLFIDYSCFTVQSCYRPYEESSSLGDYIGPLPGGNVRRLPNVLGECSPWRGITMSELGERCNQGYAECAGSCIAD